MDSKVGIVILNYNGWEDTLECLESILKQQNPNFHIVVVDNCSTNNSWANFNKWASGNLNHWTPLSNQLRHLSIPPSSKDKIKIRFLHKSEMTFEVDSTVTFILADKNGGFSYGNNIGVNYFLLSSQIAMIWLLNNDCVIDQQAFSNSIYHFNNSPNRIGILGTKLMEYYSPTNCQAYGGILNKFSFTSKQINHEPSYQVSKNTVKLDYIIGASMMIKREVFNSVGTFSEDYFLYYEELDFIIKAKNKNWDIDVCFNALVYHKEGKSIGSSSNSSKRSKFSDIEVFRSRAVFVKKNFNKRRFYYFFFNILIIFNRLRKGQIDTAKEFLKILIKYNSI